MNKSVVGWILVSVALSTIGLHAAATSKPDERPAEDPKWTAADEAAQAAFTAYAKKSKVNAVAPPPQPAPTAPANVAGAAADEGGGPLLEIHVFDVGQADAMLVIGPPPGRRTLLVDLGEPSTGKLPSAPASALVLQRIEALTGRAAVDYFVLTHYHSDHAGRGLKAAEGWGTGIIGLLSDFSKPFHVGEFIRVEKGGSQYMHPESERSVFRHVEGRMPIWVQHGRVGSSATPQFGSGQIVLGDGVEVEILAFAGNVPGGGQSAFEVAEGKGADYKQTHANENDLSVALKLKAGEFELFTAGDLTGTDDPSSHPYYVVRHFDDGGSEIYTNVERHLVSAWKAANRETDVEVYRANHHGSRYSTTQALVDALDPELILYSTGGGYGHPESSVVQRGATTADQLATTAVANSGVFNGAGGHVAHEITIEVATDGRSYTVDGKQRKAFTDAQEAAQGDQH